MNMLNFVCALFFPFTEVPSFDVAFIPKESINIAADYEKAIYFCPAEMVAVSVQNDVSPAVTRIRSPTRCDFFVASDDIVSVFRESAMIFAPITPMSVNIRSPTCFFARRNMRTPSEIVYPIICTPCKNSVTYDLKIKVCQQVPLNFPRRTLHAFPGDFFIFYILILADIL